MSVTYSRVPAGYWVDVKPEFPLANKGAVDAMIYPPEQLGSRKTWRICYGRCTEHASHLQGKVVDSVTLKAAKAFLETQFRQW